MKQNLYFKARQEKLNINLSLCLFRPPEIQCVAVLHINQRSSEMGMLAWMLGAIFSLSSDPTVSELLWQYLKKKNFLSQLSWESRWLAACFACLPGLCILGELYIKYLCVILMYELISGKCIWVCLWLLTGEIILRSLWESASCVIILSLVQIKFLFLPLHL